MEILIALLVGLVTAYVLFKWLFGTWAEFFACAKWLLIPNLISMLYDRHDLDFWGSLKVAFWAVMTGLMTYGTYRWMLGQGV